MATEACQIDLKQTDKNFILYIKLEEKNINHFEIKNYSALKFKLKVTQI